MWPGDGRGASGPRATVALLLVIAVSLVLVAVSPWALGLFGGAAQEWQRSSLIGQTYGAVSALIAMLALVGVVATLRVQTREARRAVEETRRQAMAELLRMAMDDPDLDACWGPIPDPQDATVRKQRLYTNMIVGQWATAFDIGALPEGRLRAIAHEMFRGEAGHDFWTGARERWLHTAGTTRERRFAEILDEAHQGATPVPDARPAAGADPPNGRLRPGLVTTAAFLAGAATAAGLVACLRRSHRN